MLVDRCIEELDRQGIQKCHVFVYGTNRVGRGFWKAMEWKEREELVVYSHDI